MCRRGASALLAVEACHLGTPTKKRINSCISAARDASPTAADEDCSPAQPRCARRPGTARVVVVGNVPSGHGLRAYRRTDRSQSCSPHRSPLSAMSALKVALDWTPNTNHVGFYVAKGEHWPIGPFILFGFPMWRLTTRRSLPVSARRSLTSAAPPCRSSAAQGLYAKAGLDVTFISPHTGSLYPYFCAASSLAVHAWRQPRSIRPIPRRPSIDRLASRHMHACRQLQDHPRLPSGERRGDVCRCAFRLVAAAHQHPGAPARAVRRCRATVCPRARRERIQLQHVARCVPTCPQRA